MSEHGLASEPLPSVDPLLEVRGLGKKLTADLARSRRYGISDIARELRPATAQGRDLRPQEFWALRDVSFDVAPGQAIGVIGKNGAGKSTLLRVLNGITRPDTGTAIIRGTHSALLDLGAPFNRVLSARENIATAAALQGMGRHRSAELEARVAEFSELGDVLDAPMWSFSAGMTMRLGFAIATQSDADLLLIDEVIAVGDLSFQRRCMAHIRAHLAQGGSMVLVSHDLWMIQTLCEHSLVLSEGRVVQEGTSNHAISWYLRQGNVRPAFAPGEHFGSAGAAQSIVEAPARVVAITSPVDDKLFADHPADLDIEVRTEGDRRQARWHIDILTANRQICLLRLHPPADRAVITIDEHPRRFRCSVASMPLLPGPYFASVHLSDPDTGEDLGAPDEPMALEVSSRHNRLDSLSLFVAAASTLRTSYEVVEPDPDGGTATSGDA